MTEYADEASAADMPGRTAWRRLLHDAAKRRVDLMLVWRLDRAFRSVREAANTLEDLRRWRIGLRSYQEPWLDTTSPFGEALYYITVAYAQLERGILAERVKAGMERARRQGRHAGRPAKADPERLATAWPRIRQAILHGELSRRQAAKRLGTSERTVRRLLAETPQS